MLFRILLFPAKNQTKRDQSHTKRQREREEKELLKKKICKNLLKFENVLEIHDPLLFGRGAGEISNYAGQWQTKGLCALWDYYEAHKLYARVKPGREERRECESKRKLAENEARKLHSD